MFVLNYISAIIVVLGAIFVIITAGRMPPALSGNMGPGYWPSFLGYCLLVLGIALFIETLLKKRSAARSAAAGEQVNTQSPINFTSPGMKDVYALFAILVLFIGIMYIKVLPWGNFLAATFVFVPCVMRLLGEKRYGILSLFTISVPIAVYVIFVRILGISLP